METRPIAAEPEIAGTLRSLADGVDPLTGEAISDESLLQRPDIIRALFRAARLVEDQLGGRPRGRDRPARAERELPAGAGKPWSSDEEQRLVEGFDAARSLGELAQAHARTKGAIRSRLIKLGKVEADWLPARRG